jgi:hypothetical protein
MELSAVMDDLGAALEGISGLRVFPYWADRVEPPAAIVGWPDPLNFDETYQRGADRASFPLFVLVGRVDSRSARDQLSQYANGDGARSIKQAIDTYEATAYGEATVQRVEFGVMRVADTDYLAATFTLDIFGPGGQ